MRKVDVFSLQPGMKVAKAVYSGMGDVLLKAGATINSVYIKKLIKLGAAFVYVEGEEEGEAFSGVEAKDVIARETRVAAVQQVRSVLLKSKEAGQLVIEPQSLYSTVSEFTRQLLDNSSLTYSLVDLRTQDDYTFAHSVNVSVLALMTGITLGFSRDRLSHLGVGGMLHDLGKVKVPDVILNKPGPLTRDEFAVMKQHTRLGYEMIRAFDSLGEATALIAYQHHEHFNGTGYPLGISGDEFNLNAQIVAIADKFDALTAERIYRPPYPPREAYEMFAAAGNYWFSDHIVKAFLHNIAAYSAGTLVELNNGMVAVVIDTPKGHSLFPRVRVIAEKGGIPVKAPFEVSLQGRTHPYILRVLKDGECPEAISNFPAQETKGPASRVHPQPENTPGQEPV